MIEESRNVELGPEVRSGRPILGRDPEACAGVSGMEFLETCEIHDAASLSADRGDPTDMERRDGQSSPSRVDSAAPSESAMDPSVSVEPVLSDCERTRGSDDDDASRVGIVSHAEASHCRVDESFDPFTDGDQKLTPLQEQQYRFTGAPRELHGKLDSDLQGAVFREWHQSVGRHLCSMEKYLDKTKTHSSFVMYNCGHPGCEQLCMPGCVYCPACSRLEEHLYESAPSFQQDDSPDADGDNGEPFHD